MNVIRLHEIYSADEKKVILQKFKMNPERSKRILERIFKLSDDKVDQIINGILVDYNQRHRNFSELLLNNYENISIYIKDNSNLSGNRKLLIGAYFSKEYSVESAALFNPSIVPHPDQSGIGEGELKFIISLRATGEGHISSIEFREGLITNNNDVKVFSASRMATQPKLKPKKYSKSIINNYYKKSLFSSRPLNILPDDFTYNELKELLKEYDTTNKSNKIDLVEDFANSNYDVYFDREVPLAERVLFPISKMENMGMEDARFVKFYEDDASSKYYATYTAYNGKTFRTQLIETFDFINYEIRTMRGNGIKDKGLALFPRKINNLYYMVSRLDGENLYLMKSDNLYYWNNYEPLLQPEEDWEFIQIGNCGAPIETEKGWLLITHAVGPMRKYVISAVLLSLDNPSIILGRCTSPILSPNEDEREGYVPNVVYSCGSLLRDGELILPYAMSDSDSGFAKISIEEIIKGIIK